MKNDFLTTTGFLKRMAAPLSITALPEYGGAGPLGNPKKACRLQNSQDFPNADAPLPEPKPATLPVVNASGVPTQMHRPRILVADDDEGVRHLMSAILGDAGFNVDVAADGQEAWDALLNENYDLVLTDHEMSSLSGLELIERMRKSGINSPVIIVSGLLRPKDLKDYPHLEITGMLMKPVSLSEILEAVRGIIGSPGIAATTDRKELTYERVPHPTQASPYSRPRH